MLVAEEINAVVSRGEQAISLKERGVTGHCLFQKIDRLQHIREVLRAETNIQQKALGLRVKIEGCDIGGRGTFDRIYFTRRKLCLKLISDCLRDLALDGKHIGQIAIIGLRPQMRVITSVDQLCVHADAVRSPLHTPFEQMCDAQLLPDLAQVACYAAFVLHH